MKRKSKKIIARFMFLVLMLTLIPMSIFANTKASSTYKPSLTLSLSSKKSYVSSVTINVKASSKYKIKSIKLKKGKITSTSKSNWNSAKDITKTKKYKTTENGYYSALVTDKKGNKRLKYINISNISYKKYVGDYNHPVYTAMGTKIYSINKNKIKFKMYSYGGRVVDTNIINGTLKNGKLKFNYTDSFGGKGTGTLTLKNNKVYYSHIKGNGLLDRDLEYRRK